MDGFIHAHPLLTLVVFTALVVGVFCWALFDGSEGHTDDIQMSDGDWAWPEREEVV